MCTSPHVLITYISPSTLQHVYLKDVLDGDSREVSEVVQHAPDNGARLAWAIQDKTDAGSRELWSNHRAALHIVSQAEAAYWYSLLAFIKCSGWNYVEHQMCSKQDKAGR
jgi:hypothetical protein